MNVRVGDIVKTKNKEGKVVLPAVVTKVNIYKPYSYSEPKIDSVEVLFADGTYGYRSANKITETSRHIDMQSVLDSIKL